MSKMRQNSKVLANSTHARDLLKQAIQNISQVRHQGLRLAICTNKCLTGINSCYVTKPTCKCKKLIGHISYNIIKNKIFHSDILPRQTSNHDAPCIVLNLTDKQFEILYKFIRNLKHLETQLFIHLIKLKIR